MRHRPVGPEVQGLRDAFLMLRLPFESETARKSNEDIFEAIYYAACEASGDLAVLRDHTRRSTAAPSPSTEASNFVILDGPTGGMDPVGLCML